MLPIITTIGMLVVRRRSVRGSKADANNPPLSPHDNPHNGHDKSLTGLKEYLQIGVLSLLVELEVVVGPPHVDVSANVIRLDP